MNGAEMSTAMYGDCTDKISSCGEELVFKQCLHLINGIRITADPDPAKPINDGFDPHV